MQIQVLLTDLRPAVWIYVPLHGAWYLRTCDLCSICVSERMTWESACVPVVSAHMIWDSPHTCTMCLCTQVPCFGVHYMPAHTSYMCVLSVVQLVRLVPSVPTTRLFFSVFLTRHVLVPPSCLSFSFVPSALGRQTFSSAAVVWPESAGGSTQACPCPRPPCPPRPCPQCGWALHNPGCACLAIEACGHSGECPWLLTPSEELGGEATAPGSLCVSHGAVCGQAGGLALAPPHTHVSDLGPSSSGFPRG